MHGAAFTPAVSGLFPENLGHHLPTVRAFCDAVAMTAMIADDVILLLECSTGANRHSLLADIEMHSAADQIVHKKCFNLLLKKPDLKHLAEHVRQ